MPAATNAQMQTFANERVRPFAEQFRAVLAAAQDHKSAIDDVYARGVSNDRWTDARTDGPPKLLMSGNAANPDDMLNFNSFLAAFTEIMNGTNTANDAANAATMRTDWQVLVDACVRPLVG